MALDLSNLTPADIESLRAALGVAPSADARTSPIRKQLDDLREPRNPKARLGRPNFFWSVDEETPQPFVYHAYPKLKFRLDDAGKLVEALVPNPSSEASLGAEWMDAPPVTAPVSSQEQMRAELDALSDEDRQFVLEAQRKARMDRLTAKLSGLSDADLSRLSPESAVAKSGPGRPRKAD